MSLMMRSLLPLLSIAHLVSAQCVTSGYVPCLAPNTQAPVAPPVGVASDDWGSGFWSSVQGVAEDPVQGRSVGPQEEAESLAERSDGLDKRQSSLCCRPAPVECLYYEQVPFCYTPSTTRVFFSDGSYGYLSNDTYYGADGTFIDYETGVYEYPNGTTVNFTPDSSSSNSSSGSGSSGSGSSGSSSSSASYKTVDLVLTSCLVVAVGIFTTLC